MKTEKCPPLGQGLITDLDLADYAGHSGHTIRITTRGDHHDQRVRIVIRDLLGCAIEDGYAKWDETTATWCYLTTANVLLDEILLVTAMVMSSHHQTDRQVTCIPLDLRFTTVFKTAPWAKAAGLGRWKDN